MTPSNPDRSFGEWVLIGIAALWFAAIPLAAAVIKTSFPLLQNEILPQVLFITLTGVCQLGGLLILLLLSHLSSQWRRLATICLLLVFAAIWATLNTLLHYLLVDQPNIRALLQLVIGIPYLLGLGGWLVSKTGRCTLREAWGKMGLLETGSLGWGLASAALALSPWFLVGSLGDVYQSASIVFQSITAGLFVECLWRGLGAGLLLEITGRRLYAGLIGGILYIAFQAGQSALNIDSGLTDIFSIIAVAILTTELWARPKDRKPGVWGAVAFHVLVLAVPRLFVDPRSEEELAHLAAASVVPIAILVLGLLLFISRKVWPKLGTEPTPSRLRTSLIAVITWAAVLALYFSAGTPGFANDGYLIILKEQVDLDKTPRSELYAALVGTATRTQASIRKELDSLDVSYRPYYLVNMIRVDGTRKGKAGFEQRNDVALVLTNPNVREYPIHWRLPYEDTFTNSIIPWGIDTIEADLVWEMGYRGEGIVVAGQDTGYDWQHTELLDSYRGWDGQQANHNRNWHDAWDDQMIPFDDETHGTHTMGTVVGNNVGMAPDAQWIGCRNMRHGIGNPGSYVECMEFFFAPYPHGSDPFLDGDTGMAPNIVNNSWGCPPEEGCVDPEPIRTAAQVLRAAGILMVVSAGNDGPDCSTVWIPASEDSVLAVGASNETQDIVTFSSRGPTDDGLVKPDVAAPGVSVISSIPGQSYSYAGGTSMAGPHVAGLAALLWSAQPDLIGDIDLTEQIITSTAQPYPVEATCPAGGQICACGQDQADLLPNNVAGYGIVDAQSAVEKALNH